MILYDWVPLSFATIGLFVTLWRDLRCKRQKRR